MPAFLLALLLISCSHAEAGKTSSPTAQSSAESLVPTDLDVCFSPNEACDAKLVALIRSAKTSIDVAIYSLTHPQIVHELLVASKRIPVRFVVDRLQAKGHSSLVSTLEKAKASLRYGRQRGIMHHKFLIVDAKIVETGSFNYTEGATFKNRENQVYLTNAAVVARYQEQFEEMWESGVPVSPTLAQAR